VSSSRGVWIFDPIQETYQQLQLPPDLIDKSYGQMIEYPKDQLIIGSFDVGMISWDLKTQKLQERFTKKKATAGSLTVNSVYSLFADSRENLWIGLFHGANKINLSIDHFKIYENVGHENDLRNYTLVVYGDPNGGVWSNTMRGIYYRPTLNDEAVHIYGGTIEKNQYRRVGNFSMDKAGKVWFGIGRQGVFRYDVSTGETLIVKGLSEMSTANNIRIYCDNVDTDIVWVTSDRGLCRYDQKREKSTWYHPKDDVPDLANSPIELVEQFGQDKLVVSHKTSLLIFDKLRGTFTRHPVPRTKIASSKYIVALAGEGESVWAATGNSLYNYHSQNDSFQIFTPEEGLGDGTILSFERDGKGKFWFGQNGITKYDSERNSHQNFTISHRVEALIYGSSGKSAEGHLLFPAVEGILAFKPENIVFDTVSPKVVIRKVLINNESAKTNHTHEHVDSLTLTWDDKIITFEYAGLKFNKAKGLQYKIKLDGFDDDWRPVGRKRDATYTNLDPGAYRFQVIAANADGYWSKEAATVNILILPPYWKTKWFSFLCLLLLSGIVFGVVRNYLYSLRLSKEKAIAEQNTRYKSLFLANMSHEIRTPMNTIVGMNELMLDTQMTPRQQEFSRIIDLSSKNLLVIVNDILDHAKIESGKYTFVASPFRIHDVVDQLRSDLESRALEKDLSFKINLDSVPTFLNGDTVRLKQILTNLLTNAIKFTDEGAIILNVTNQSSSESEVSLLFEVRDTGSGISEKGKQLVFESFERELHRGTKNTPGAGLGLSIAKNLVEQQGGRIWFESPPDKKGASFFVHLTYPVVPEGEPVVSPELNRIHSDKTFAFLIVEDSIFNQLLLRELLLKRFPNSIVEVADNGQEAVKQVEAKFYDLVFMDIKMPVMDGFKATEQIRSLKPTSKSKTIIVAVTASAVSSEMKEYEQAGMDGAISKPIQSTELYEIIGTLLKDQL
jgi:signal transduction histidine kinase/ligand-binding sensor domain-containing protein/ActR/RegA family two-component response regulator